MDGEGGVGCQEEGGALRGLCGVERLGWGGRRGDGRGCSGRFNHLEGITRSLFDGFSTARVLIRSHSTDSITTREHSNNRSPPCFSTAEIRQQTALETQDTTTGLTPFIPTVHPLSRPLNMSIGVWEDTKRSTAVSRPCQRALVTGLRPLLSLGFTQYRVVFLFSVEHVCQRHRVLALSLSTWKDDSHMGSDIQCGCWIK